MQELPSISAFVTLFGKNVASLEEQMLGVMEVIGKRMEDDAKGRLGHYLHSNGPEWRELSEYTMMSREARGFTPNEPLTVTRAMHDSITHEATPWSAVMGIKASEMADDGKELGMIAFWHEFGTAREPPRPFLGPALYNQMDFAFRLIGKTAFLTLANVSGAARYVGMAGAEI